MKQSDTMQESKLLRQIMADFQISGQQLARQAGVPYQKISEFRSGKEISRISYVKIIQALRTLQPQACDKYLMAVFGLKADNQKTYTKNTVVSTISEKIRECIRQYSLSYTQIEEKLLEMNKNGISTMSQAQFQQIQSGRILPDRDELRAIRVLVDPDEEVYSEDEWQENITHKNPPNPTNQGGQKYCKNGII